MPSGLPCFFLFLVSFFFACSQRPFDLLLFRTCSIRRRSGAPKRFVSLYGGLGGCIVGSKRKTEDFFFHLFHNLGCVPVSIFEYPLWRVYCGVCTVGRPWHGWHGKCRGVFLLANKISLGWWFFHKLLRYSGGPSIVPVEYW